MCVCRCISTDLCVRVRVFTYLRAYAYARVCPCVRTRAVGDRQGRPLPFERRQRAGSAQAALPSALRCVTRAHGRMSTLALPGPGSWGRQSSGLAAPPGVWRWLRFSELLFRGAWGWRGGVSVRRGRAASMQPRRRITTTWLGGGLCKWWSAPC